MTTQSTQSKQFKKFVKDFNKAKTARKAAKPKATKPSHQGAYDAGHKAGAVVRKGSQATTSFGGGFWAGLTGK